MGWDTITKLDGTMYRKRKEENMSTEYSKEYPFWFDGTAERSCCLNGTKSYKGYATQITMVRNEILMDVVNWDIDALGSGWAKVKDRICRLYHDEHSLYDAYGTEKSYEEDGVVGTYYDLSYEEDSLYLDHMNTMLEAVRYNAKPVEETLDDIVDILQIQEEKRGW
tara:strand:+ start:1215 stop:1712 length:498 start_codon:yes stop_codon:yes gene_type:complete